MSLLFWRKRDSYGNDSSVAANEDNPLPVRPLQEDTDDAVRTTIDMQYQPPIAGQTITRVVEVPGIGTAAAYADKDAFGTLIVFRDVFRAEKCSGTVTECFLIDKDDEGIQVEVPLYTRRITVTADNSALALSDDDLVACRGFFSITNFFDAGNGQYGKSLDQAQWINGEDTNLYCQLQIRGAANIAAGAIPLVGIKVVPD